MSRRSLIVLIFAVLLFSLPTLSAYSQSRGRLPDGAAYRTDREGNQLVDYVAELELKNEALERRIHGLEAEVEGLRSGSSTPSPRLFERGGLHERNLQAEAPEQVQYTQKDCPLPNCGELECDTYISEVRQRSESVIQDQQRKILALQAETDSCRSEVHQAKSEQVGATSLPKIEPVRQLEVSQRVKTAVRPVPAIERKFEGYRKGDPRASLNSQGLMKQAQGGFLLKERETLRNTFRNIIQLREKRDSLFKNFQSDALKISQSKIVASDGKTPEQLLKEVDGITTVNQYRARERVAKALLMRVKSDIALIQRLKK
ncbi:MAG: hypothetical protein KDD60_02865 [Bdellovibrionales bacterium]|nr:hypothetical protein [Bdellovibrionales bacterium]